MVFRITSYNVCYTKLLRIGGEWPVGEGKCERGMVIIASFEDDHDDTTKPRLEAARTDTERKMSPSRLRILHVVGARPNFMKISPIMDERNNFV